MAAGGSALAVLVSHGLVLTAAAWAARRPTPPARRTGGAARHRFLVLIPAHDEERLIGSTLDSLALQTYPADSYRVHVVADNCTDRTAEVVRTRGVEAHERVDPTNPGKGPALQWLLQRLWDRGERADAVVIIDADTIVGPEFLAAMDDALATGAEVVQGYYAVRNAQDSELAGFRAAALAVRHWLRPLGRTRLGGSSGLYGNGMAFRSEVLVGRPMSNHLTEDAELQLELLLAGTRVAFAPDAVIEAEMPDTVAASESQHERWERGRLELCRRYARPLARRVLTGGPAGRFAYLDSALDLVTPPFSVIVAATSLYGGIALLWAAVAPGRAARRHVAATVALVAAEAATVLSALHMIGAPRSVYRSLLAAPRMVAWKVTLWLRMLLRPRQVAWTRTTRNVLADPASTGANPVDSSR